MIRIENIGAIAYGGAVTITEWWDNKRIDEGKIAKKDIFKKASFYTYLGVGLAAMLASVFGWMPRWARWTENISIGFLYDVPRFTYNLTQSLGAGSKSRSGSAAVQEAQRILGQRQLASGVLAQRSYQPEFATPNSIVL